jgi:hypothetical protein
MTKHQQVPYAHMHMLSLSHSHSVIFLKVKETSPAEKI